MDKENFEVDNQSFCLKFYGGVWMSFLPFIIFISLIILTTFVGGSISDGALWIPAFLALLIPLFFAKNKHHYTEVIMKGMASKETITPIVGWIFAGVFSAILKASGLAGAIAGFVANIGCSNVAFTVITFLSSALFATASGTGFGTIAIGMGVLYPAGLTLGCHPALLAGAIISGAAFGDNLAPISDTTICSATSQGVDVPGVVRSRLKYSLVSAIISIIIFIILAGILNTSTIISSSNYNYDSLSFFMLIAVVLTIITAIKTGNMIFATTIGIISGSIIGILTGQFTFLQVDPLTDANALFLLSGEGLDRSLTGIIYSGINGMIQVSILALLLFGTIAVMRYGKGDIKLLEKLESIVKNPIGAELIISLMVIVLSAIMGLNAPAILAVGSSFAKPLSKKYGISSYRTANLLDAQSNTLCYAMPWTPAAIFTIGFASNTTSPLKAIQITPFVIYGYVLFIVMIGSIFLKIGRNDGATYNKKTQKIL